ncbi:PREDICTED: hornerin-like [Dufourea novaeangliae]|uniref:Uncharacterized protein n=1 Tax=Dufourea novaeangliae TaxID=178035 RepID=A0A154PBN7_DUFNO|nr:PREDICTED: hornerin-like [Dufourea novaeangliae]KZC09272.1 hypothetical protein WN55_11012 [Dufourea novaeangliae]
MWRVGPIVLALFVCCVFTEHVTGESRPSWKDVDFLRRIVRETEPLAIATEIEDLLGEGNAPENNRSPKQRMKNGSGKSDEGGYYKTYGSDAEGEKGYLEATYSKGNHGYKTLDTFHKRDGDKYAFEKHVAYGKANADKKSSHHHHDDDASSGSGKGDDHEGAGTVVDSHYTTDEGDLRGHSGEHVDASDHGGHSEGDGARYTDHGPESSSYGHGGGYTAGDGENGSYESHSSYSRSYGDGDGHRGGHYY